MEQGCILWAAGKLDGRILPVLAFDFDRDNADALLLVIGAIKLLQPEISVLGLAGDFGDLTGFEFSSVASHPFFFFREVTIAVAVYVQGVAVQDKPDASLGLRTEHQQTVLR